MLKIVSGHCRVLIRSGISGYLVLLMLCALAIQSGTARAQTVPLDRIEHIHGLIVDAERPKRLYLATHSGLFLTSPNGTATRAGGSQDDLMSFAANPIDANVFYASGHPPGGGNLGVLISRDRGWSWERLAPGADGPVTDLSTSVTPSRLGKKTYNGYRSPLSMLGIQTACPAQRGRTRSVVRRACEWVSAARMRRSTVYQPSHAV